MAALPAARGFAYNASGKHHDGWRSRSEHQRPGPATYAWWAYSWDGVGSFGLCPARYVRTFKMAGDVQGEWRMYVEALWLLNYNMLIEITGATDVVPTNVLEFMAANPNVYVEASWTTLFEFESYVTDARVYPLKPDKLVMPNMGDDAQGVVLVGLWLRIYK